MSNVNFVDELKKWSFQIDVWSKLWGGQVDTGREGAAIGFLQSLQMALDTLLGLQTGICEKCKGAGSSPFTLESIYAPTCAPCLDTGRVKQPVSVPRHELPGVYVATRVVEKPAAPPEFGDVPFALPEGYYLCRSLADFFEAFPKTNPHPHENIVVDAFRSMRMPSALVISQNSIHPLSEWRHLCAIAKCMLPDFAKTAGSAA